MKYRRITNMDRFYMDKAYEQAQKSVCLRTKIGTVFVKDGQIIAQGYNNMTGDINDCAEVGCIRDIMKIPSGQRREVCRAICAKQLAISEAARNGIKLDGSVAYITTFPCHVCAKLLVSSGISEIVYDKDYPDELSEKFLEEAGTNIRKIQKEGVLYDEHKRLCK